MVNRWHIRASHQMVAGLAAATATAPLQIATIVLRLYDWSDMPAAWVVLLCVDATLAIALFAAYAADREALPPKAQMLAATRGGMSIFFMVALVAAAAGTGSTDFVSFVYALTAPVQLYLLGVAAWGAALDVQPHGRA